MRAQSVAENEVPALSIIKGPKDRGPDFMNQRAGCKLGVRTPALPPDGATVVGGHSIKFVVDS